MFGWMLTILGLRRPRDAGGRGEALAAAWLRRERGFAIVARNWRSPRDRREEIDLVARDGDTLVFVEVKSRSAAARVPGVHAVDARKKRVLRRAVRSYLAALRRKPGCFRFDVVEVTFPSGATTEGGGPSRAEIIHFENLPLFPKSSAG